MKNHNVLKITLIFFSSYLLFYFLWLEVKDYYGLAFTWTASYLFAFFNDASFEALTRDSDIIRAFFRPFGTFQNRFFGIEVHVPEFTNSIPVTFAIMAAAYPFLKRKGMFFYALTVFFAIDVLWVFFRECEGLSPYLANFRFEEASAFFLLSSQYAIMSMPFFTGFYMVLLIKQRGEIS